MILNNHFELRFKGFGESGVCLEESKQKKGKHLVELEIEPSGKERMLEREKGWTQ